ncbi:hypothetical protein UFOVP673_2 [uncultured Caudovirales phage]|uniref:Uncharacterized protein n=1 Tax=uncultured Caudovirales phage TaxID=2100421 RepID=A0A6J5ND05_9CAUD|nr:hypothetical protein UFOVP673_2 [uncultured Caudovirales phage]
MNHDLTPWLDAINEGPRKRAFFVTIFRKLEDLGFILKNPDAIDGGYRLEFRNDDNLTWVIADRHMSWPVAGEDPGIQLYSENEAWEASFRARTPTQLVLDALEYLTANE